MIDNFQVSNNDLGFNETWSLVEGKYVGVEERAKGDNLIPRETLTPATKVVVHNAGKIESGIFVPIQINGKECKFLVDSGADVTIVNTRFLEECFGGEIPLLEPYDVKLVSATGDPIPNSGKCDVSFRMGRDDITHKVIVADVRYNGILGLDFMTEHSCDILVQKMCLRVKGQEIPCFRFSTEDVFSTFRVALLEDVKIPPNSEFIAQGRLLDAVPEWETALVEPNTEFMGKHEVLVARSLVNPTSGKVPLKIMNVSDCVIELHKHSLVGSMEKVSLFAGDSLALSEVSLIDTEVPTKMPEHLDILYAESCLGISEDQKMQLENLLIKYQGCFSKTSEDMGLTDRAEHRIDTGNSRPIKQAPRRIPLAKMQDVNREIKEMLAKGVIEESDSPWSSPIVLVKKKDNSIRFCIDYRRVNEVTIKDSHPIPRIESILDALSGSKFYSTIDLKSGYWQVKVAEEDKPKTAFSIPGGGHWNFTVMPFGLCNAGATFQRLMEKVLSHLSWEICMVYLDDIIVLAPDFSQHLENLDKVFGRLKEANLKINPKKCKLFQREVSYLGHIINGQGIKTDPDKIDAVQNWPRPNNIRDVRSFLGICSYYRKFVKGFSVIAKPLHKLTEKSQKFVWDSDCQEAFDKLKRALTSSPILSYPRKEGQYVLDTDASNTGMGSVLSQIQDGDEKVLSYYSKLFNTAERRYCVTRRELLAIVQSIKHFHHYLYGQVFKIRTDHGSLRWLLKFKNPEGQIARWLETLASYQFEIEHRPGRLHGNADALSRRPCAEVECPYCAKAEVKYLPEPSSQKCSVVKTRAKQMAPVNDDEIINKEHFDVGKCQIEDPDLCNVIKWVQDGTQPNWGEISHLSETCKFYWVRFESLEYIDNVLYYVQDGFDKKYCIVIPKALVGKVLTLLHNSTTGGHLGIKKTLSKVRDRYFWYKMSTDTKYWCVTCDMCESRKSPNRRIKAPLQKYIIGAPLERVAIDIMGPLPKSNKGNLYILVMGDYFTKWVDAVPIRNQKATTVAQKLIDRLISIFGTPMQIHSDQGRSFESDVFREMCRLLGIEKTRTTPYRPQSDGLVERANRTIENMLASFVSQNQKDWDEHLPLLMLAYRSAQHETTGVSPCEMMFGRHVSLPADLVLGRLQSENTLEMSEYAYKLSQTLDKIHEFARGKINLATEKMLREYNSKINFQNYKEGDLVWYYAHNINRKGSPKLQCHWQGPCLVLKRINDVVYKIGKTAKSKPKVVHYNLLKPYKGVNRPN